MTGQEALEGFQTLSRKFRKAYKGEDLNKIWRELLTCSHSAYVRAIGIIAKNSRRLPDPEYVLEQTRQWENKMLPPGASEKPEQQKTIPEDEGRIALENLIAWLHGDLDVDEYIRRLYAMSETYGKPGYAREAMRLEQLEAEKQKYQEVENV
jgi:hypothetical protein